MSLPMAVSHVALFFTDVLDQITDTLEPIGFIMRNFNPGKVLKSNKELEPIKPVSATWPTAIGRDIVVGEFRRATI